MCNVRRVVVVAVVFSIILSSYTIFSSVKREENFDLGAFCW